MAIKKRRKHGQLQSQILELLKSNPKIKTEEVATKLNISPSNAYRALNRVKEIQPTPKVPSKVVEVVTAVSTTTTTTALENRLLDMVRLIGFDRATALITAERARLLKMVG